MFGGVYREGKQYETKNELGSALRDEWAKIESSYLQNLAESMKDRCCELLLKKGAKVDY